MKKNIFKQWHDFYDQDMYQLGSLFEYVGNELNLSMEKFIPHFMNSAVRADMDTWNPWYSNEPAPDLYRHYVERCGDNITYMEADEVYKPRELQWIGEMYAFLRYYTSLTSVEIYKEAPLITMRQCYHLGHEMDYEACADRLVRELSEPISSLNAYAESNNLDIAEVIDTIYSVIPTLLKGDMPKEECVRKYWDEHPEVRQLFNN